MVDYYYPFWRRVIFLALLVLIVVVAIVPAVSTGTINVRIATISTPAALQHVYLKISQLELHTAGLPSSIGWVSLTSGLPTIDLATQPGLPSTISTAVQSGRYDAVRISISQATLVEGGITPRTVCTASCAPLNANVTVSVPPSGYGDVLLIVSPSFSGLLGSPSTFILNVVDVRSQ